MKTLKDSCIHFFDTLYIINNNSNIELIYTLD